MYELQFGFLHCVGKKLYSAGFTNSLEEAQEWVKENRRSNKKSYKPPKEDPIVWCPVKHCHLKKQSPFFSFREI